MDRMEDSPSYRLGVATEIMRALLSRNGLTYDIARSQAITFLDQEDARTAESKARLYGDNA